MTSRGQHLVHLTLSEAREDKNDSAEQIDTQQELKLEVNSNLSLNVLQILTQCDIEYKNIIIFYIYSNLSKYLYLGSFFPAVSYEDEMDKCLMPQKKNI